MLASGCPHEPSPGQIHGANRAHVGRRLPAEARHPRVDRRACSRGHRSGHGHGLAFNPPRTVACAAAGGCPRRVGGRFTFLPCSRDASTLPRTGHIDRCGHQTTLRRLPDGQDRVGSEPMVRLPVTTNMKRPWRVAGSRPRANSRPRPAVHQRSGLRSAGERCGCEEGWLELFVVESNDGGVQITSDRPRVARRGIRVQRHDDLISGGGFHRRARVISRELELLG